MRIIVFGIGNYYKEKKEKLKNIPDIKIVAYSDNNTQFWNRKVENIEIIPPSSICQKTYDKVLIMSTYISEIYVQLTGMHIDSKKIITWEELWSESVQGQLEIYAPDPGKKTVGGDVLIISTALNYNGGSLAAVYAAMALKSRGLSVMLASPEGNQNFIRETVNSGIKVMICPALPYIYAKQVEIIRKFDAVMVNVFQMIKCVQEIRKIRPVLWWIHEPSTMYAPVILRYPECMDRRKLEDVNIFAVSKKAQKNFNSVFPGKIKKILPYGIPDMSAQVPLKRKQDKKLVFAVIGAISRLKSQDVFLRAILEMKNTGQAEFWIIGAAPDPEYYKEIKYMAGNTDSIKLIGELTRKEIYDAFSEIDVVVCTSQEETLSITITEAMMLGKVCISSDHTGIVDYIKPGINGFIIPQNDARLLAGLMQWIIENIDKLENLKVQARKTYENNFSMKIFGENLELALLETKEMVIK